MHVSVNRLSLLLCWYESRGNLCSMEAVLTFMISQGRAFGIFSLPSFQRVFHGLLLEPLTLQRENHLSVWGGCTSQVLLAYTSLRLTCLSNLSDASVINDCMIQPNLKEVRISYKLDKYRFNIICYINLFSSLQPKAEWTVLSTLHTQKSFCRAGFRVCTNKGLLSVIGVQWLYLNKFWTKLLFKKMLPSMLKFVMAETICADERCFPKVLLAFCTRICLFGGFFGWTFVWVFFFFWGGGVVGCWLLVVFFYHNFTQFEQKENEPERCINCSNIG